MSGLTFRNGSKVQVTRRSPGSGLDCAFLSLVGVLSVVGYVGKLGFYSDDWSFLATLSMSPNRSILGLFRSIFDQWMTMRPVQVLYLAVLYRVFDLTPIGYHLVNSVVLLAGILLFYLSLRELDLERALAVAVPALYLLLPGYSTVRFWVASFQISLSMTLYFLSLYGDLKSIRTSGRLRWIWKAVALTGLVGSALAYEVFLPLFLLNLLVTERKRRATIESTVSASWREAARVIVPNLLVLSGLTWFKLVTTIRLRPLDVREHAAWLFRLLGGAVRLSFWDYGVGMPAVVMRIVRERWDWSVLSCGFLIGVAVFICLRSVLYREGWVLPSRRNLGTLILVGLILFVAGYAIFVTNENAANTPTGINNRIAIAGAVGTAISLVAGVGLVSVSMQSLRLRCEVFCILMSLLCASGSVITSTIGSFWTAASDREREILADIQARFPTLPKGTTLILDGVCPYVGPGIVFESSWDLAGALQLLYQDLSLKADIVTPSMVVKSDGLMTSQYFGSVVSHYPYDHMIIYDFARKRHETLGNAGAAERYFRKPDAFRGRACPPAADGHGVSVFQASQGHRLVAGNARLPSGVDGEPTSLTGARELFAGRTFATLEWPGQSDWSYITLESSMNGDDLVLAPPIVGLSPAKTSLRAPIEAGRHHIRGEVSLERRRAFRVALDIGIRRPDGSEFELWRAVLRPGETAVLDHSFMVAGGSHDSEPKLEIVISTGLEPGAANNYNARIRINGLLIETWRN